MYGKLGGGFQFGEFGKRSPNYNLPVVHTYGAKNSDCQYKLKADSPNLMLTRVTHYNSYAVMLDYLNQHYMYVHIMFNM